MKAQGSFRHAHPGSRVRMMRARTLAAMTPDGVTEVDCMSSVANHRDVHVGAHLALHLAYSLGRRKQRVTSKERLAVHSTCGRKPLHSTDFSFSLPRV
jgi:lactam utilization protein B